ncbi:endonuclease/exonuclease/phosphatase family protein [Chitinophaga lutea]
MKLLRAVVRRTLLWTNIPLAIGLLLSWLLTWCKPDNFWPAGFAGLPFFYLWIACLAYIPVWLWFRRKFVLISAIPLLITLPALLSVWAFSPSGQQEAGKNSFTVMTFNCSSMGLDGYEERPETHNTIYQLLGDTSPDVLCLQEFYYNTEPGSSNYLDSIAQRLGYPYRFYVGTRVQWDVRHYGTVLFSRFPIIDSARVKLFGGNTGEDMISARLLIHGDTIRLLSAHLASHKIESGDYHILHLEYDKMQRMGRRMRQSFHLRTLQAHILREEAERTAGPVILMGDFNDTPVSYTYRTARGNLQDAWLAKGNGLGRTFSAIMPTLRIDYILPSRHLEVEMCRIERRRGLHHFPVMARLHVR